MTFTEAHVGQRVRYRPAGNLAILQRAGVVRSIGRPNPYRNGTRFVYVLFDGESLETPVDPTRLTLETDDAAA